MANVGALREAVRTSNISLVKRLVKGGVCVDERLWYGRTLLQECVTLSDVDMVQSLIEYGEADVNAQNDDGKTALHIASRAGSLNIVSLLIEAGARIDTQCLDGTTSLHLAMWKNKSEVVEKLIKAGANPNLQDQDYWTPLHWGVQSRNLDLVKLLVENGANMDIVNKSLLTPFTQSLEICCFPIAKYMLFMGAGVQTISDTKKTPKSVISLLLRPEVVTNEEVDVPKIVMLLVENGYNLWNDVKLLSVQVMANKKCEEVRQFLLSQISNPPQLLNLCRNKVWDLLRHKRARRNFSDTVRSLQIPTHLQNFLLTRAELRLQQLAKNSSSTTNRPYADLTTGSDLKKTGIIRLKKTSSLISDGKEMARLQQDHPSTSKSNLNTDTSPKKMVPTRIVFNSPHQTAGSLISAGKEMARLEQDHSSTSKSNLNMDTSPKKMVPTRIVFNSPHQTAGSLISAGKEMARLEHDPPSTSKSNLNMDTSPKKMVPTRIVFNSPHQTAGGTSLMIRCPGNKNLLHAQTNSNTNISMTLKASSSNDTQINQCKKKEIPKPKTLTSVPSTDTNNKIPATEKVRKLCRFNFDMAPTNSESGIVEGCAKKRRAWKTEEPVS